MRSQHLRRSLIVVVLVFALGTGWLLSQETTGLQGKNLEIFHSISSHFLKTIVAELTSDTYEGRLTGTDGYNRSADWVAGYLKDSGVDPGAPDGSYFQSFDIPYTLIFEGCEVIFHIPQKKGDVLKHYKYVDEFIPGSTSGSGEITDEVVYVGYGVTAPELGYDDYAGVDVRGKIVLMEREVPVSPGKDVELFKKWRSHSFHQAKLHNAVEHGAQGMLYNYGPIGNPNNAYIEDFIYSHIGDSAVKDLFSGTGKEHAAVVEKIRSGLKPQSFSTGKTVTIRNITEHHPEGKGSNVIGMIRGADSRLKDEVIVVGAHLDHLGRCYEIMPGANDNASGVAVVLSLAEALAMLEKPLRRSVLFVMFGADEQAIVGSKAYLERPPFPLDKTACFINLDGVGAGDKLSATAAKNYPALWKFIDESNSGYVHRFIRTNHFHNLGRPRLDAARFMWAGIPSISFGAYGSRSYYHTPQDNLEIITPEIMEDLTQILFLAVMELGNSDRLDFPSK